MSAAPLLTVADLRVVFEGDRGSHTEAVSGVSFSLMHGRTLGIVGESGCGKSVTALSIMRRAGITVEAIDLYEFTKLGLTPSMLTLALRRE